MFQNFSISELTCKLRSMGIFEKIFGIFKKKLKLRFLIVGLDNSGKSTLINAIKPKEKVEASAIAPTVGYATEKFEFHGIKFQSFDMSGQGKYRDLWEHHFNDCDVSLLDAKDDGYDRLLRLYVIIFPLLLSSDSLYLFLGHPVRCRLY